MTAQTVEKLTAIERETISIKGEVASIKGEVNSIKGEVNSIKGEVSSIKGEVSSIKGEVSSIKSEVALIKEKQVSFSTHFATKADLAEAKLSIILWLAGVILAAQLIPALPALLRGLNVIH